MRVCTKCKTEKDEAEFGKKPAAPSGLHSWCRMCLRLANRDHYRRNHEGICAERRTNRDRALIAERRYEEKNREKRRAAERERAPKRREHKNAYRRQWLAGSASHRIGNSLRATMAHAVRRQLAGEYPSFDLVGCSVIQLIAHLEAQFQPGMSWDNYGFRGWHIDHKRPCASFDLSKESERRQCFHYSNLQPLWWRDNISKGAKVAV